MFFTNSYTIIHFTRVAILGTLPVVHCGPFLGALDASVFASWIMQKKLPPSFPGLLRFQVYITKSSRLHTHE